MNKQTFKPRTYRAHNAYDTAEASNEAAELTGDPGPSLTVQAMAEDADINVLMKRYGITGKMPDNPRIPMFGDFTGINDYRTALEAVNRAHEGFMEIPADVRGRFENDPQKFMEWCADKNNLDEMRKLGLAKPVPQPTELSQDTKAIIDALKPKETPKVYSDKP